MTSSLVFALIRDALLAAPVLTIIGFSLREIQEERRIDHPCSHPKVEVWTLGTLEPPYLAARWCAECEDTTYEEPGVMTSGGYTTGHDTLAEGVAIARIVNEPPTDIKVGRFPTVLAWEYIAPIRRPCVWQQVLDPDAPSRILGHVCSGQGHETHISQAVASAKWPSVAARLGARS
jgi:hypothetical protein